MDYVVKRLRFTDEQSDFIRDYSKAKGISETMAIRNMVENEKRRCLKQ